jgi:zinc transporter 9
MSQTRCVNVYQLLSCHLYQSVGTRISYCQAYHALSFKAILGFGLREAERQPDKSYQYGYGRAAFFYSLLTALSTFGFGAMYTFYQGVHVLIDPAPNLQTLPETWAILGRPL